jgi:hypothetical protein
MPQAADFRNYAYDNIRVDASGKDIGRRVYWKLYAIENVLRVIVHSVLTAEVAPTWWSVAVDPGIKSQVVNRKTEYANQPWHSTPGGHEIYYAFLSDLNKVITANSHLFERHIPDIDQWIARIEQIRLPRNIVGHMNWLSATDRNRIDVFYADIQHLTSRIAITGLRLLIP